MSAVTPSSFAWSGDAPPLKRAHTHAALPPLLASMSAVSPSSFAWSGDAPPLRRARTHA
eukprot:CAMPEP_0206036864 /NCGR_PEP_ID=MMETSP1466-20131121/3072_1 /ASSEMBLY_ACC=CAM_ASM_001126 /TAXON_ID=44452 /ORGANISM="Pavlova gyrans, Strain CCMP608" /LENGTH=58 /DNA_ID=CAMNT_0053411381 /DNA_START=53 /DNA_END=225 /DNA_ORIENTATION=+